MLPTGRGKDLLLVQCTCMRHNVKDTLCLDQVVVQVGEGVGDGGAARGHFLSQDWFCGLHHIALHQFPTRNANDLLTLRYVYPIWNADKRTV